MHNQAKVGRFYIHYKGGLYFINQIKYVFGSKSSHPLDVIEYIHVSGSVHSRTREDFESLAYRLDADYKERADWPRGRPGLVAIRFYMLPENFKINHKILEELL